MRIVAGKHRGRPLLPPADISTRPTSDRTRQALFTILEHAAWSRGLLEGAVVLDAFCGTGALGLEALSHGAAQAFFLDKNRAALDVARRNAQALKEETHSTFLLGDALHPPLATTGCNVVFLDPPYGKDLVLPSLSALAEKGWLKPEALIVVETAKKDPWPETLDAKWTLVDQRVYGDTCIRFLCFAGEKKR